MNKDLNRANLNNLFFISKVLRNIQHFVFFGTLLGLTRHGQLIDGDDDIDIYIDIRYFDDVLNSLHENDLLISKKNSCFLQVEIQGVHVISYIDFYFYEYDPDKGFIKDKWNFYGLPQLKSNHMHIPSFLIYPIKTMQVNEMNIFIPNQPELICEFLYGKNWKFPLKKNVQYKIFMISNRPKLVVGFFSFFLMSFLSNLIKLKEHVFFKLKL